MSLHGVALGVKQYEQMESRDLWKILPETKAEQNVAPHIPHPAVTKKKKKMPLGTRIILS